MSTKHEMIQASAAAVETAYFIQQEAIVGLSMYLHEADGVVGMSSYEESMALLQERDYARDGR